MSANPAGILDIDRGSLRIGKAADLTIIDVEKEYEIRPETFESKGRNCPFTGRTVFGQTACTVVGGRIVWREEEAGV